MRNALKRTGLMAAGMLPAAFLAEIGVPALTALVLIAVLTLAVICWILNSGDRSDRLIRMLYARYGDARCLATSTQTTTPTRWPPSWHGRSRTRSAPGEGHHLHDQRFSRRPVHHRPGQR